jgi:hypothetical protein
LIALRHEERICGVFLSLSIVAGLSAIDEGTIETKQPSLRINGNLVGGSGDTEGKPDTDGDRAIR